jgi:hypothetical protein
MTQSRSGVRRDAFAGRARRATGYRGRDDGDDYCDAVPGGAERGTPLNSPS